MGFAGDLRTFLGRAANHPGLERHAKEVLRFSSIKKGWTRASQPAKKKN
jgi:hypothetical protein